MENKVQIKSVLVKASSFIRKGWCRGTLAKKNETNARVFSSYCLIGAINRASNGHNGIYLKTISYIRQTLISNYKNYSNGRLDTFNDESLNKKRVLKLLKIALKSL